MKDHIEDLNKQLGMLESLEKQVKVVNDLKAKLQKGKLKTIQQNYEKELKTLGLEWDMFRQKKLRTETKFESKNV